MGALKIAETKIEIPKIPEGMKSFHPIDMPVFTVGPDGKVAGVFKAQEEPTLRIIPDLSKNVGVKFLNPSNVEISSRPVMSQKLAIAAIALAGAIGVVIGNPEIGRWIAEQIKAFASLLGLGILPIFGMVMGGEKDPQTEGEFQEKLSEMNERLKPFDEVSALKEKGEDLSPDQRKILHDPFLNNLNERRFQFLRENYRFHSLETADEEGNPTRAQLEANQMDLGSHFILGEGGIFSNASEVIRHSEMWLELAYWGTLQPGEEVDLPVASANHKGGVFPKGVVRFLKSGELVEGVDVGLSQPGGRVVLEVRFDRPIGKEGVAEISPGNIVMEVKRKSGGREEPVFVIDGEKPDANTMYIIGGPYGPSGRFGLYRVFPGRYSPPLTDEVYWNHHAFLTGERGPSWKVGPDLKSRPKEGSRLAQMESEGRVEIQGLRLPTMDLPSLEVMPDVFDWLVDEALGGNSQAIVSAADLYQAGYSPAFSLLKELALSGKGESNLVAIEQLYYLAHRHDDSLARRFLEGMDVSAVVQMAEMNNPSYGENIHNYADNVLVRLNSLGNEKAFKTLLETVNHWGTWPAVRLVELIDRGDPSAFWALFTLAGQGNPAAETMLRLLTQQRLPFVPGKQ